MSYRKTSANLFHEVDCGRHRHEFLPVGAPEFVQAASGNILHRKVSAKAVRSIQDIGIKNPNDVRVTNLGQHDGLAQHFLDLLHRHPDPLEDFHRLPTQKAVADAVYLGKCPFSKKALDLVGIAD